MKKSHPLSFVVKGWDWLLPPLRDLEMKSDHVSRFTEFTRAQKRRFRSVAARLKGEEGWSSILMGNLNVIKHVSETNCPSDLKVLLIFKIACIKWVIWPSFCWSFPFHLLPFLCVSCIQKTFKTLLFLLGVSCPGLNGKGLLQAIQELPLGKERGKQPLEREKRR